MGSTKSPMEQLAEQASKILLQNRECLVAYFFRRFPNVDPTTVRLVSQIKDGRHYFWLEFPRPKGTGIRRWPNKGCDDD